MKPLGRSDAPEAHTFHKVAFGLFASRGIVILAEAASDGVSSVSETGTMRFRQQTRRHSF